jgi:hypothetical protein
MTFFYDLNKRMAELANKQTLAESKQAVEEGSTGDYSAKKAAAGKDIGKPGKVFGTIAKDAAKRYGSKEKGEKVAGAVLAKLRAKEDVNEAEMDESALQAYLGKKKYGEQGMKALQQAGRDGASKQKMASIRAKHDKMDEAEMDEGNEFSGALAQAKAAGAKEFEVGGKKYQVKEAAKPDFLDLDKDGNKKESMKKAAADKKKEKERPKNAFDPEIARSMFASGNEKGTGKFDKKKTATGTQYTRRYEEEPEDEEVSDEPKKKGRKEVGAGKGKKIGAKSRGTSKLASKGSIAENNTMSMVVQATGHAADLITRIQQNGQVEPKELMTKLRAIHKILSQIQGGSAVTIAEDDMIPLVDKGEYDREGDMAKEQLHTIELAAEELASILGDDDNLPEWVQSKITKAMDYVDTARDYMISAQDDQGDELVAEKAVSKQQQKFMGMAHAMQKGEKIKGASAELKKVAKTMKKSDVEDFAATKHKGLPKKVKEADAEPKAAGGIKFGQGVYESINSRVEKMITEGMNVSVNMSIDSHGEPTKNITVSAEGDDADKLAQLLNLAGMSPRDSGCGCGQTPCGCNTVEEAYGDTDPTENKPDYPTDAETTGEDDELLRRWAGGLNKPKSTGQTTAPVIASQVRRQTSMEESVELERSLFKTWQNYKG